MLAVVVIRSAPTVFSPCGQGLGGWSLGCVGQDHGFLTACREHVLVEPTKVSVKSISSRLPIIWPLPVILRALEL